MNWPFLFKSELYLYKIIIFVVSGGKYYFLYDIHIFTFSVNSVFSQSSFLELFIIFFHFYIIPSFIIICLFIFTIVKRTIPSPSSKMKIASICLKLENKFRTFVHQWSSGKIVPCHGTDPGSIPGWCKLFSTFTFFFFKTKQFLKKYQLK